MTALVLTREIVLEYHRRIIAASDLPEDQGTGGLLLTPGNLDFTLDFSTEIVDPFERAAFLLYHIATGHAFVQGNKRIAFLLAALALLRTPERYQIESSPEEINRVVRDIAENRMSREDVASWLRSVAKNESE